MSNLDCNISYFNTRRDRITVRVNIFSSLASPIKTRSKSGPNFTPLTLSTAKKLQESKLTLLKFNHSKTRTTSQTCSCEKNLSTSPENNISWVCCSQCNQCWLSSCAQIFSKDLVKYSKYHIHYSVVKKVSCNKSADTEQGTNKAVNKVSKSTNLTLSRTAVSKNINHFEKVQEPNKIPRFFQISSKELSLSDSQTVDSAESASNSQTENKRNILTATSNLHRVIFDNITISTIKTSVDIKRYVYKYTDN